MYTYVDYKLSLHVMVIFNINRNFTLERGIFLPLLLLFPFGAGHNQHTPPLRRPFL